MVGAGSEGQRGLHLGWDASSVPSSFYSGRLHRLEQPRDHIPPLHTLGIKCSVVLTICGLSKISSG